MSSHVVPLKVYIGIFLALLFFTGLTTWVAFIDLGPLNTVVALAIATVKMLLVILFFMNVRASSGLTKVVVAAGFFWLALLIAFTLSDELTRQWSPIPSSWGPGTSQSQSQ
jgi:cytochrome c oxidase subunit IV